MGGRVIGREQLSEASCVVGCVGGCVGGCVSERLGEYVDERQFLKLLNDRRQELGFRCFSLLFDFLHTR